jgi:hypothetical protein
MKYPYGISLMRRSSFYLKKGSFNLDDKEPEKRNNPVYKPGFTRVTSGLLAGRLSMHRSDASGLRFFKAE